MKKCREHLEHLAAALRLYWRTELTWHSCWRATGGSGAYRIVRRADGHLYVEPWPER